MIRKYHSRLVQLYERLYNDTLKPLIAAVETAYEKQPAALFNEIRNFNDHIARCYRHSATEDYIKDNLWAAETHLRRAILDCFKHLNIYYHKSAKKFERSWRYFDVTTVDNGKFHLEYRVIKQAAIKTAEEAKILEAIDQEKAFTIYEKAYNKYVELDELISESYGKILWARTKFSFKNIARLSLGVLGLLILGIIINAFYPVSLRIQEFVKTVLDLLIAPGS